MDDEEFYEEESEPSKIDIETQKIIDEWKREYEDIYLISIKDEDFIYRLIPSKEYRDLITQCDGDNFLLAEEICQRYILDPVPAEWVDTIPAGYIETLAQTILEESGLLWGKKEMKERLDELENNLTHLDTLIMLTIKKAFPEYSIEEVESWNLKKQMRIFTYAKWMIRASGIEFDINFEEE